MKQLLLIYCISLCSNLLAQSFYDTSIKPGDTQINEYLPILEGKRVGLIINQSSVIGDSSLLDMLINRNIHIQKIFVPEHGFRGKDDAGALINAGTDSATGLQVISLYGAHKKPQADDLRDIDIMVYDLQDVGVRFYTYISTLEYCMQACSEQHKKFLLLDRPNPNGFYVDGPVLEMENRSFVGRQPIPIVYGMTAGEYARMLVGEHWIDSAGILDMEIIKCINYAHNKRYKLPIAPSPNLKDMAAVYAYPSLCLFEGTATSVGRGTDLPFRQYGSPALEGHFDYYFVPASREGAKKPSYEGTKCFGEVVAYSDSQFYRHVLFHDAEASLCLKWLINSYQECPDKTNFFNDMFDKLGGSKTLKQQITNGISEQAIRKSWQEKLDEFKKIRRKYLLYQ